MTSLIMKIFDIESFRMLVVGTVIEAIVIGVLIGIPIGVYLRSRDS